MYIPILHAVDYPFVVPAVLWFLGFMVLAYDYACGIYCCVCFPSCFGGEVVRFLFCL